MARQIKEIIFQDCPIRNILSRICGKWQLVIIYTLKNSGNTRFSALLKKIPDSSSRVLISSLRSLEADGLVSRKIYPEVPPKVEYMLTPRAMTFIPVFENLVNWSLDNMTGIMKDRAEYDKAKMA